jgi:hypothetical protein
MNFLEDTLSTLFITYITLSMNYSVTLYHSENADIKVDIEARFDGDTLIIDGYDIGKRVEEYWGDSDYEYTLTIPPESVQQLYNLMNVWHGDKQSLLQELAKRYQTNTCFSEIRKLLDDNAIQCEGFSWI